MSNESYLNVLPYQSPLISHERWQISEMRISYLIQWRPLYGDSHL